MANGVHAYFERIEGGRFQATRLTSGAWVATEQHISPMNGLIVHEIERWLAAEGDAGTMQISRISVDILGPLLLTECAIEVERVRGGRAVELLEARVTNEGRVGARARVWRVARADSSPIAGGFAEPMPAPDTCRHVSLSDTWIGDYIATLDIREAREWAPGSAAAWLRTNTEVASGEDVSNLARFIALCDTANGVAVRASPLEWQYPNVDITIHLLREPRGEWVGLDTHVTIGTGGMGVTHTVLHDTDGHVGFAAQSLIVRPRPM